MLKWIDVIKFANNGNPKPVKRVEKTEEEWKEILTPDQFRVTRQAGTERAFSSEMCSAFEPGKYACVCCKTVLFDSGEKFESGTGWPSFTQPIQENVIAYHKDTSHGMVRVETTCNTCDAHLGHVFQDGPPPSGLRYCMNAVALQKVESKEHKAVFGGGCFWCTEAIFQEVKGVKKVESGYSGGEVVNPTYREVTTGRTGHAEVVQITYDATQISFEELITIHLTTHDPTTLNRQGADTGTQYRSVMFYQTDEEKQIINQRIEEIQAYLDSSIVTEVAPLQAFYKAEDYHQNYYRNNPAQGYCQIVIEPKLIKFRKNYQEKLVQK